MFRASRNFFSCRSNFFHFPLTLILFDSHFSTLSQTQRQRTHFVNDMFSFEYLDKRNAFSKPNSLSAFVEKKNSVLILFPHIAIYSCLSFTSFLLCIYNPLFNAVKILLFFSLFINNC